MPSKLHGLKLCTNPKRSRTDYDESKAPLSHRDSSCSDQLFTRTPILRNALAHDELSHAPIHVSHSSAGAVTWPTPGPVHD